MLDLVLLSLLLPPPPSTSTLFPYTTLFRSNNDQITAVAIEHIENGPASTEAIAAAAKSDHPVSAIRDLIDQTIAAAIPVIIDRKSTRLNSSHVAISYAVFCLIKKTYI